MLYVASKIYLFLLFLRHKAQVALKLMILLPQFLDNSRHTSLYAVLCLSLSPDFETGFLDVALTVLNSLCIPDWC